MYRHGYSRVELADTLTPCRNCSVSSNVTPVTLGFYKCHYRIFAVRKDGSAYKSYWYRALLKDKYQMCKRKNQFFWKRLGLEARALTVTANEPCSICLEIMDGNDGDDGITTTLECFHQFHTKCISLWKLDCPMCRAGTARLL